MAPVAAATCSSSVTGRRCANPRQRIINFRASSFDIENSTLFPLKERRQCLLKAINQAITHTYLDDPLEPEEPFRNWPELVATADEYLAKQREKQPFEEKPPHLRLSHPRCLMLICARNATDVYELSPDPSIYVAGLTPAESRALLQTNAVDKTTQAQLEQLAARVGYLPLALVLLNALRQHGYTLSGLLTYFEQEVPDLRLFDINHQATSLKSLLACFDLSYDRLQADIIRRQFTQLGCFAGLFDLEATAVLWQLSPVVTRRLLYQLVTSALVIQDSRGYRLHPLWRDYARQKLTTDWPEQVEETYQRHAAYYLRHYLYHPQILAGSDDAPPALDEVWA
jgi:hypothetical protein